ncbi:MAG: transglycosylase SLT domain-containing protein [Betaproteobacteria bacterium]|nr:transglycosylase SLT domain-containing protein [Betaproteobacteria bacterium]
MKAILFSPRVRRGCTSCIVFLACLLIPVSSELPETSAEQSIPVLRVVIARHTVPESRIAPFGPGFEQGLVSAFCEEYGYTPHWIVAGDQQSAIHLLKEGQADIMAGFTGLSGTIPGTQTGPAYHHAKLLTLSTPDVADNETLELPPRMESQTIELWRPFLPTGHEEHPADSSEVEELAHCWCWRDDDALLAFRMHEFWQQRSQSDDTLLARLNDLHFGFLPRRFNPDDLKELTDAIKLRLPSYSKTIALAAQNAEIDPLLLIAVIFQESRFDPKTVSITGVRGIMQLTAYTANFLKVDRHDPDQAITGGARYLRYLWDSLEDLRLDSWDRWFFTLAAFNQGPRRLEGAMELSRKLGGSGRTWQELKQVYPLLSQREYAALVGQNTCRGGEAVSFVQNVRWYYHVLHGLVTLLRPEAEYLTPLFLASVPVTGGI